jgi:hypothetical protein
MINLKPGIGILRKMVLPTCLMIGLLLLVFLVAAPAALAGAPGQIPTGSIPTVTGTPVGAIVIVLDNEQGIANVRAGPHAVAFEIVGVLVVGSQAPALGRTPGGDWIMIAYPGVPGGIAWIWKDLVEVRGSLPVVELPPTPTRQVTPTLDPTLAAQFIVEAPPTRLPTFTEPPPLVVPTIASDAPLTSSGRVPMGLIIVGLAVVGMFGLLISFLRTR